MPANGAGTADATATPIQPLLQLLWHAWLKPLSFALAAAILCLTYAASDAVAVLVVVAALAIGLMKSRAALMSAGVLALLFMSMAFMPAASARLPEFTDLVKRASPAVVNITTTRSRRAVPDDLQHFEREDLPEILQRFFREAPEHRLPLPGVGSGFIISEDGYILTNNHVIDDADEIIVALGDRREREAEIVGQDPLSDLALLKIDEDRLPIIEIGNSGDLEAGQWVVAIGSPFGFEHSVTAGIVSATGRSLPEGNGNYVPFIQTDVAINPGNSGGPLLDLKGRAVGINSQIYTRSGGFMGLSFAIPIDVAMDVVEQLKDKGRVSRGWLGVLIQRVNRDLAESFGLDRPAGALVTQVFSDSPAEEGGLKEGDIILSFDGKAIDLSSDLPHLVGRTRAETKAQLRIVRNGKRQSLTVTIGKLDEDDLRRVPGAGISRGDNRLGMNVTDLTEEDSNRLNVERGVLVRSVTSGPAREAGIQRGDVITTLDGEWVDDARQFEQLVEGLPTGTAIHMRIVRHGTPNYLAVKIPE